MHIKLASIFIHTKKLKVFHFPIKVKDAAKVGIFGRFSEYDSLEQVIIKKQLILYSIYETMKNNNSIFWHLNNIGIFDAFTSKNEFVNMSETSFIFLRGGN